MKINTLLAVIASTTIAYCQGQTKGISTSDGRNSTQVGTLGTNRVDRATSQVTNAPLSDASQTIGVISKKEAEAGGIGAPASGTSGQSGAQPAGISDGLYSTTGASGSLTNSALTNRGGFGIGVSGQGRGGTIINPSEATPSELNTRPEDSRIQQQPSAIEIPGGAASAGSVNGGTSGRR
ncbi:MAG: hypothetical protein SFY81_10860 [Verrucomicrobiota bacterium]|nr:hypothetical protein [Verrucomicrobiota bacterium]